MRLVCSVGIPEFEVIDFRWGNPRRFGGTLRAHLWALGYASSPAGGVIGLDRSVFACSVPKVSPIIIVISVRSAFLSPYISPQFQGTPYSVPTQIAVADHVSKAKGVNKKDQ